MFFKFAPFFVLLFSLSLSCPAPSFALSTIVPVPKSPTAEEKEVLIKLGNRVRSGMGTLLTPARGSIRNDVKAARVELWRITMNLRGNEITEKKLNLVINIYDAGVDNASMSNLLLNYKKGGQTHLITRSLLGFTQNNEPIYELAVSSQILNLFTSEDEIALIIGHELAHLLQGHVEEIGSNEEMTLWWWSSQQRPRSTG